MFTRDIYIISNGYLIPVTTEISTVIILFAVYSFTGWIIEVIYRSYKSRKFINAGFLHWPFLPIYGMGALVLIYLNYLTGSSNIAVKFLIFTASLTVIEYITGVLFETIFKLVLWDYSENRFNIKGKVCLSFSVAWGIMAILFTEYLHPFTASIISRVPEKILTVSAAAFTVYLITDIFLSVAKLNMLRKKIAYLYAEYLTLSSHEIDSIMATFRRILSAFPNLNNYLNLNITKGIKNRIDSLVNEIKEKPLSVLNERKPNIDEHMNIVKDIMDNEEFRKLDNFHHHNSSILEHAKVVSWISYSICKYLNLDYRSAARGALLHDFFLYDWRNHDVPDLAKKKFHGIEHPKIALTNSEKHFTLNKIEKDIIIKHMWPLTLIPPVYRESFIVTFVDKYTASREFVDAFPILKKIEKDKTRIKK